MPKNIVLCCDGTNNQLDGHHTKGCRKGIGKYEKLSATFKIDDQTVMITSKKVGFNYVKFTAELAGKPESLDNNGAGTSDGEAVLANVMNDAGEEVLVDNGRLTRQGGPQTSLRDDCCGSAASRGLNPN
jgi:hypothetical protein